MYVHYSVSRRKSKAKKEKEEQPVVKCECVHVICVWNTLLSAHTEGDFMFALQLGDTAIPRYCNL